MSKESKLTQALLAENGLNPSGAGKEVRLRYLEKVLRDSRRLRRVEAVAVVAWVLHGLLFITNWIFQLRWSGRGLTSSFGLVDSPRYRLIPLHQFGLPPLNDLLYWLDGVVFLLALLATLCWLFRARWTRTSETELRLATIESELNRLRD